MADIDVGAISATIKLVDEMSPALQAAADSVERSEAEIGASVNAANAQMREGWAKRVEDINASRDEMTKIDNIYQAHLTESAMTEINLIKERASARREVDQESIDAIARQFSATERQMSALDAATATQEKFYEQQAKAYEQAKAFDEQSKLSEQIAYANATAKEFQTQVEQAHTEALRVAAEAERQVAEVERQAAEQAHAFMSGLGVAVGVMAELTRETIGFGTALSNMSGRTGISTTALQEFAFAGKDVGVSGEQIAMTMTRLQRSIMSGSDGISEAAQKLGLSMSALKGMKPEQQFSTIVTALGKMEDVTKRNALAMQLMGRGGAAMVPLGAKLAELTMMAHEFGAVLQEEDVKALDGAGDAIGRLKDSTEGLTHVLFAGVVRFLNLQEVADGTGRAIGAFTNYISQLPPGVRALAAVIQALLLTIAGAALASGPLAHILTKLGAGALPQAAKGFLSFGGGLMGAIGQLGLAAAAGYAFGTMLRSLIDNYLPGVQKWLNDTADSVIRFIDSTSSLGTKTLSLLVPSVSVELAPTNEEAKKAFTAEQTAAIKKAYAETSAIQATMVEKAATSVDISKMNTDELGKLAAAEEKVAASAATTLQLESQLSVLYAKGSGAINEAAVAHANSVKQINQEFDVQRKSLGIQIQIAQAKGDAGLREMNALNEVASALGVQHKLRLDIADATQLAAIAGERMRVDVESITNAQTNAAAAASSNLVILQSTQTELQKIGRAHV